MTDNRPSETSGTPTGVRPTDPAPKQKKLQARWLRSLRRSPIAIAGFAIISFFLVIVAFAPFLAPYSPTRQTLRSLYVPPGLGVSLRGPEGQLGLWVSEVSRTSAGELQVGDTLYPVRFFVRGERWTWFGGLLSSEMKLFGVDGPARFYVLGTDEQGRDLLSRIIHGAWISLSIGLITIGIGIAVGVPVGALSGYFAGTTDLIVQRVIDTMLAFPGILLAIVLVATFGTGLRNVMIAVGIASIPVYARLVRASVMTVRDREYVEAARALGRRPVSTLARHVMPNVLAPIIVQSSLQMAVAILFAAGLGFLGLGARPPQPEWGLMLSRGRDFLAVAPHVATSPGLAIVLVVMGFNLVGDALRDALDPRAVR